MDKAFRYFLLVTLCNLSLCAFSQPGWTWAKGEGGLGNDASDAVTVDDQGNMYATGNIAGNADFSGTNYQGRGEYDMFIAKYDPSGNLVWVKLAGGIGNDQGMAIKCKNGYLYVAGYFSDTCTWGSTSIISKGDADGFIAKYDLSGNVIWVRVAGGTGHDNATGIDVDDAGNVFVAGTYASAITVDTAHVSTNSLYSQSFFAKFNSQGDVQWAKTSYSNGTNLVTGLAFDHHNSVFITGFLGGDFTIGNTTVSSSTSSYDIFLAKIDENGVLQWMKRAGGTYEDEAQAVCSDKFGNAILTGYFAGTAYFDNDTVHYDDYDDVFVAKYDSFGNNMWVRAGKGHQVDVGYAIAADDLGHIFVTGVFQDAIDFDGMGLTGQDRDIFVAAYNQYGTIQWVDKAGGVQTDAGLGIAVANSGTLAISGYYLHTCFFGSIQIDIASYNDLFVAEYNPPAMNDGIREVSNDFKVSLYPSPVSSSASVSLATPGFTGETDVKVYNATGSLISALTFSEHSKLNINGWPAGIYFFRFSGNEKMGAVKLFVE